jgi:hypothetical protein
MGSPRSHADWEAIHREYRAGTLSVRELATMFGITHTAINKKIKQEPEYWIRDLTQRVKAEVSRRIVSDEVSAMEEETIVEEAASRAIAVVRRHRTAISKLAEIEVAFAEELSALDKVPKKGVLIEKPVALSTKVATLLALASAAEKRIKMERQAFGITEDIKAADEEKTTFVVIGVPGVGE